MTAFIETFLELTERKKVHMFGFGAIPKFPELESQTIDYAFPCSGDSRPGKELVDGVVGALETYRYALNHVELSNPTYFSPLLKKVIECTESKNQNHTDSYSVFLAITDGMFYDVQETIDLLVEASFKPFSLILVGLGEDHKEFEGFYHLSSLECRDSKGRRPARNLCRFVHFE